MTNCKNCGTEISKKNKFCPECGILTGNTDENSSDSIYDDELRTNRIGDEIKLGPGSVVETVNIQMIGAMNVQENANYIRSM
ncbi:MAG: zinc-ribbon domain-containing protein [Methanobacterium sp. ERen5]|nr:MAG: zinc-ribbon domain-containing protein [Methanobacterium sp. ERen5]